MKRLLLLGGGHTHVEVLRRFGAEPLPDTRVVLVSPDQHTAYSGMLPGYIAGHYSFADCHIDLARLSRGAGVTFRRAAAIGVDAATRRVECDTGEVLEYDLLSIDVGSTQPAHSIPGAIEHALAVKPVARFIETWDAFRAAARAQPAALRIAVVGGGAAGVELALAMQYRLAREAPGKLAALHIITDTPEILSGHPRRVKRTFESVLDERRIALHAGARVLRVEPGTLIHARATLPVDLVVLANGAAAPAWLRGSGIELDENGFVRVSETLQSLSHGEIFAAGDVATMVRHPRPKSGVYAVRQGPPLTANLRRALAGQPPAPYRPQKTVLALISTGDRCAVASWNGAGICGGWVWRWKDWIDRRFMATYR